jgi:hypothetical protein
MFASTFSSQYNPQIFGRLGKVPVDVKAFMKFVLNDIVIAGGSAQLASRQPTAGGAIIEAETATVQGGPKVTANSGNTGSGYVDLTNSTTGSVQFTFNAPAAGLYTLEFRYAQDSGNVPVTLSVNGTAATVPISFWTTGSKSVWQAETRNVNLVAGNNVITLTWAKKWGALDHVNIIPVAITGVSQERTPLPAIASVSVRGNIVFANLYLKQPASVLCAFYDARGRMVKRFDYRIRKPGFHSLTINPGDLRTGCYFFSVKTGSVETVRKFTIVR